MKNNKLQKTCKGTGLSLLFLLLSGYALLAQQANVLVTNVTEGDRLWIKWVAPTIYTQEPVNVYRRTSDADAWQKLNEQPITMLDAVPNLDADDPNYRQYLTAERMVQELSFEEVQEGLFAITVALSAFESNDVARFLGMFYEDTDVVPGTRYQYRINTVDGRGNESELALSEAVTVGPYTGIEPPAGLQAIPGENQVSFTWLPEIERYLGVNVYRDTLPNSERKEKWNDKIVIPSKIENEYGQYVYPPFFFLDDSLDIRTTYYYEIRPVDFFGRESNTGNEVAVKALDETPPDPITDLRTEREGEKRVRLKWTRVFGKDLAGYKVYRNNKFDENFEAVSELLPKNANDYTDVVPDYGDYAYYVASVDFAGNETPSNMVVQPMKDSTPPAVPTGMTAEGQAGQVVLRWEGVTDGDLGGYQVYRAVRDRRDEDYALITPYLITGTVHIDTLPRAAKNEFYYKVVALDTSYNRSALSATASAAMPDVVAPTEPVIFELTKSTTALTFRWFPALDEDVVGYELQRATGTDSTAWTALTDARVASNVTSYTDAAVQPDTEYRYRLRAVDVAGNASAYSNVWTARTPRDASAAAVAERLSINYNNRKKEVRVKWRNSAPDVKGSMLYRQAEGGRYVPVSPLLPPDLTEYADSGIAPETTYRYQLRTYYRDGRQAKSVPETVVTR